MDSGIALQALRARSRIAFIDDDPDYLDAVALNLGRDHVTYESTIAKLDPLLERGAALMAQEQTDLMRIVKAQDSGLGGGMVAQLVHAYFANPKRHDIVGALVVDYSIPVEDGISLCARHKHRGLRRVLLTGVAGESEAIRAFNGGKIELFLHKHTTALKRLNESIHHQLEHSAAERGEILKESLDGELKELLAIDVVHSALSALLAKLRIVEHLLVGYPQGMLCLRADQDAVWLQLETAASRAALADTMQHAAWSKDAVHRVGTGQTIVDLDWMAQLSLPATESEAVVLSKRPYLAAGVFKLEGLPSGLQPSFRSSVSRG